MNFYSLLSIQNNCSMFIIPLSLLHSECHVYLKKFTSVSWLLIPVLYGWTSLVAQTLKYLPAMQKLGLIPGSGRSPGEGNGYLLQYSCLENSIDRGAWWATVHGVAKSWTRLMIDTFTFIIITTGDYHLHKSREPRVSCLNPGKPSRDLLQHVSRPDSPTMAREQ